MITRCITSRLKAAEPGQNRRSLTGGEALLPLERLQDPQSVGASRFGLSGEGDLLAEGGGQLFGEVGSLWLALVQCGSDLDRGVLETAPWSGGGQVIYLIMDGQRRSMS